MLSLAFGLSLASCNKKSHNVLEPAPVMNRYYFLPAYVTDLTAPSARINFSITSNSGMPDAIYYSVGIPATGVTFTIKDATGAILTTLTGVPQGTVFLPDQYYIVNLPSSFIIPAAWVGKIVTITASNSTAFTKYKII